MLLPIMMAAAQAATGYVRDNDGAFVSASNIDFDCTCQLVFNSDGTLVASAVGGSIISDDTEDWYSRAALTGIGADYDLRGTVNSGSASGPAGWNNLSSARTWQVTDTTIVGGPATANITFEIRDAATLTVVATGTLDMSALKTT